jgi:hypothetical protein
MSNQLNKIEVDLAVVSEVVKRIDVKTDRMEEKIETLEELPIKVKVVENRMDAWRKNIKWIIGTGIAVSGLLIACVKLLG